MTVNSVVLAVLPIAFGGRHCVECGHIHTTAEERCPACHGVREHKRARLVAMSNGLFSEAAFIAAVGP